MIFLSNLFSNIKMSEDLLAKYYQKKTTTKQKQKKQGNS